MHGHYPFPWILISENNAGIFSCRLEPDISNYVNFVIDVKRFPTDDLCTRCGEKYACEMNYGTVSIRLFTPGESVPVTGIVVHGDTIGFSVSVGME